MEHKFNWNLASFILIAGYLILALSRLTLFPVYLDIYYHLGVMQGFELAGGIVTWDFWEFAPEGRPHFYPPLLHLLMLFFYKLGFSKISLAIFFSFIAFPFYIFSFWFITKKIFSPRLAFFVVLVSLLSYNLFLGLTNTLAATLAIIILWGLFFSIEKDKKLAAVILTALLFYTHYAISILGLFSLGLYFILCREAIKEKALLISGGLLLALPWLVNFFSNIGYLRQIVHYDLGLEINIILVILSLPGVFFCIRAGKTHLFFVSLLLLSLVGTLRHPYRLFSAQGAVGIVFAGAVFLEKFFIWVESKKIFRTGIVILLFVFIFNLISFSMVLVPFSEKSFVPDALFANLFLFPRQDPAIHSFRDVSFYRRYGQEFKRVIDIINEYTQKGDIIYSNFSYQAGIFSAFTERANATMAPYALRRGPSDTKYIRNARLILWLKNLQGKMEEEQVSLAEEMRWEMIAETEMFYIYRNPAVDLKMKISPPVLPTGLVFLLMFCSFGLIIWDWMKG